MLNFQEIIFKLQEYWSKQGCAIIQPYDMEVGAGTSHTATFLNRLDLSLGKLPMSSQVEDQRMDVMEKIQIVCSTIINFKLH